MDVLASLTSKVPESEVAVSRLCGLFSRQFRFAWFAVAVLGPRLDRPTFNGGQTSWHPYRTSQVPESEVAIAVCGTHGLIVVQWGDCPWFAAVLPAMYQFGHRRRCYRFSPRHPGSQGGIWNCSGVSARIEKSVHIHLTYSLWYMLSFWTFYLAHCPRRFDH